MDPAVVETRALTKRYGRTVGVADLDLELHPGEIFGFIGPNGAGKTTTIRLLLDLIRPTSGSVALFGLTSDRAAVEIRHRIGYLPARLTLYDRMNAADLFDWLGRFRPNYDAGYARALAERFSLDCSRRIGELSSGNRQKVGLVQAFMHRPDLLILDEPTSGLDPVVRREFRELVSTARDDGATILLSSHVLAEVEDVCDRVGTIVTGRLRAVTGVDELAKRSRRHIRVVYAADDGGQSRRLARLSALPEVHGLRSGDAANGRPVIELDAVGPVHRVIKTLADGRMVDLVSRAMTLEEVFLESYDDESQDA